MPDLSPRQQARFLKKLAKSAKKAGTYDPANKNGNFHDQLRARLVQACVPVPWAMRLTLFVYRSQLRRHELRLATTGAPSPSALYEQIEQVESLRFAVHYGRRANAQQRVWCMQQIERYQISPLTAPFLVWTKVINTHSQKINFGHLDWIIGTLMMLPVLLDLLCALFVALSHRASPELRAICTTGFLVMGYGTYDFYKSVTFDVFRVGLCYFRPNGLRTTPLSR